MPLDSDAWCASHGVPCVRYAMALKDTSTDGWGIVFAPSISKAESNSIISGMEFRGFLEARKLLDTPQKFVAHLALHELAHLENGWGQELEYECDRWAFERLDDAL